MLKVQKGKEYVDRMMGDLQVWNANICQNSPWHWHGLQDRIKLYTDIMGYLPTGIWLSMNVSSL